MRDEASKNCTHSIFLHVDVDCGVGAPFACVCMCRPMRVCLCVQGGCCWLYHLQVNPEFELHCLLNIICLCCKGNKGILPHCK